MNEELKKAVQGFEDFINEPPPNEDLCRVREYRHELYPKWEKIRRSLSTPAQAMSEAEVEALGQTVSDYFADLDNGDGTLAFDHYNSDDIDALVRALLRQLPGAVPEQEPVAWRVVSDSHCQLRLFAAKTEAEQYAAVLGDGRIDALFAGPAPAESGAISPTPAPAPQPGPGMVASDEVMVPREPSEEMLDAAEKRHRDFSGNCLRIRLKNAYRAMLNASPASQPQGKEEWRPIASAPKDGTNLLLISASTYPRPFVGSYNDGQLPGPQVGHFHWRAYCCGRFSTPTHWMPLPASPAATDTGGNGHD